MPRDCADGGEDADVAADVEVAVQRAVVDPRLRVGAGQRALAVPVADHAVRHAELQVEHLDLEHVARQRPGHRHRSGDDVRAGPSCTARAAIATASRRTLEDGTPKPPKYARGSWPWSSRTPSWDSASTVTTDPDAHLRDRRGVAVGQPSPERGLDGRRDVAGRAPGPVPGCRTRSGADARGPRRRPAPAAATPLPSSAPRRGDACGGAQQRAAADALLEQRGGGCALVLVHRCPSVGDDGSAPEVRDATVSPPCPLRVERVATASSTRVDNQACVNHG